MFDDTITLYHHKDGSWDRIELHNVQCNDKESVKTDAGKITKEFELEITIPYREGVEFGLDNLDVVIIGKVHDQVTNAQQFSQLKKSYPVRTIASVVDNTRRSRLKHWRVTCK